MIKRFFSILVLKIGLLFLVQSLPYAALSQVDTTLTTIEIEVSATKITRKSPGSFIQTIQKQDLTLHQTGNLTNLLSSVAGLFFKTYGQGSLATSSLRGGGASHTSILWNGFNLQNPMNGVTDFSLFPIWLTDAVSVQYGGGSSLQGSGVLGGVVFIENSAQLQQGLSTGAGITLGSFGEWRQFGKVTLSGSRAAGSFNFIHQQAKNDFPIPGKNGVRQTSAENDQWAFSQNNTLRINDKQKLETFAWWQKTDRNVPPSLTENNPHARQEDDVVRLGLDWTRIGNRQVTKVRVGHFRENLLFFSDLVDSTQSRSRTSIGEVEQAFFWKNNQILRGGLNFTRQTADTKETGTQQRTRMGLFVTWQRDFFLKKLTASADGRQEWVDDGLIPLVGSAGVEWKACKTCKIHGRISRNFNLPTFNDLYWRDAFARGNPNLRPETAWGQEVGFRFEPKIRHLRFSSQLTFFNSWVKNWILWAPMGTVWQPENKRNVWARGLEHFLELNHGKADSAALQTSLRLTWSLTRSTVEKIYRQDDPSLRGKQLIYTPFLNGSLSFSVFYRTFMLNFQHTFTGKRFTTTDNSEANALPPFQVSSLNLGKTWKFQRGNLSTHITIGNVLNTNYQAISARPMPGRHVRLEVTFEFSGKK